MVRIGSSVPSFRLPALVDGQLTYMDLAQCRTRWVVLCFVHRLELLEAVFLDRHVDTFHREGVSFLAVSRGQDPLHEGWINQFGSLRVPIVADPLRRLHRRYRINATETPPRCQTFFIDPDGLFRFHLVHDLNGRDMSALLEILRANRTQEAQRSVAGQGVRNRLPVGSGALPADSRPLATKGSGTAPFTGAGRVPDPGCSAQPVPDPILGTAEE